MESIRERADTRQSASIEVIEFATTGAYRCNIFRSKKNGSICRCYLSALAIFEFETYYYVRKVQQRFCVTINWYIWGLLEQFVAKFRTNFRAGEEKTLFSLICAFNVRPAWIQHFAIFRGNVRYVSELNPFFTLKVLHLLKKKKRAYVRVLWNIELSLFLFLLIPVTCRNYVNIRAYVSLVLAKISLNEFKTLRRLTLMAKGRYELFKQPNKRSKSCINCSYDSPTSVQDSTKIKKDGVSMFVARIYNLSPTIPNEILDRAFAFLRVVEEESYSWGMGGGQIRLNLFVEFNLLVDAFDRRVGTVRDIPYPRRAHPLVLVVIVKYMRSLLF